MNRYVLQALGSLFAYSLILAGCTSSPSNSTQTNSSQAQSTASSTSGLIQSSAGGSQSQTITLVDDLDRTVSFEKPERVAVLIGSFADELANAGGEDLIVAAAHDTFTQFDLDLKDAADLGDVKNIAQETLIAAKPELVIASAKNDSQKKMLETLDQAGIPVVYYDVSTFEDYLRVLKAMSEITGDEEAYQKNGLDQQEAIDAIRTTRRDEKPKVLALRETGKGIKALGSKNSLLGQMLNDLQADNIAGESGLETLSLEEIQLQNPDAIFYVAQGKDMETAAQMADQLFTSEAWKNLDAVKNGRVYVLDQKLYNLKPNAKWASALKDLEGMLYSNQG